MPAYIKIGDIDGESFVFRKGSGEQIADAETQDTFEIIRPASGALLLPAVQAATDRDSTPSQPIEDLTLNYTEVEWTY